MNEIRLTLLAKPGCHLCDDARGVVESVVEEVTAAAILADEISRVAFEELNILDDPALLEEYSEDIPVVLLNGHVHNYWRIDPLRLRKALLALMEG